MQWAVLSYAFAVGMAATVNPCGAAMLPAYLTWFTRSEADRPAPAAVRVTRAVGAGLATTLGFVAVFAAVGALVRAGFGAVMGATPYAGIAVGVVLVAVGALTAAGRHVRLRLPGSGRSLAGSGRGPWAMAGFGVSYALASLGCTLPVFLAGVAGAFTRAGFGAGLGAFVAYGLGMGSVLTALAVAVALAPRARLRRVRALGAHLERPAGVLLAVVGAYLVYYWVADLLGGQSASGPIGALDAVAGRVAQGFAAAGPLLGVGLTGAVVAAVGAARLVAVTRRRRSRGPSEGGFGTALEVPAGPVPAGQVALGARRHRRARRAAPFVVAGVVAAILEALVAGGLFGWGGTSSATAGTATASSAGVDPAIQKLLGFDWLSGSAQRPPPFTLRDQHGQPESLSSFRGKAVILTFNDNHCQELCPLYAGDVRAAVADLGPLAQRVAFVAVNVNPFFPSVASDVAFDRAHGLSKVPEWHYLTGPLRTLEKVWRAYGEQPITGPDDSVAHDPTIEFIGPSGTLRGLGSYGPSSADATRLGYALATVAQSLLGVHTQLAAHTLSPPPPSPAAHAPAFTLTALGSSAGKISLRALRGHLVVLNFFASWCSACQAEAAGLASVEGQLPATVRMVGVDVSDTRSSADAFVGRYHLPYPIGFDAAGDVAAAYGVSGLPTTVFVSPTGRVLARHIGGISSSTLTHEVGRLLGHH